MPVCVFSVYESLSKDSLVFRVLYRIASPREFGYVSLVSLVTRFYLENGVVATAILGDHGFEHRDPRSR